MAPRKFIKLAHASNESCQHLVSGEENMDETASSYIVEEGKSINYKPIKFLVGLWQKFKNTKIPVKAPNGNSALHSDSASSPGYTMSVADSSQVSAEFSGQSGVALKIPPKQLYQTKNEPIRFTKSQAGVGIIFLLATLLAAIFITYLVTKDSMDHAHIFEGNTSAFSGPTDNNYDSEYQAMLNHPENPGLSTGDNSTDAESNAEETDEGPTAAELRLSQDLIPLWYNLSMKVYVPGFVTIPEEKNLTFDGALILKFRVIKSTNVIELNAMKLNFNESASAYELFEDDTTNTEKRRKRFAQDSSVSSSSSTSTSASTEFQINANETTQASISTSTVTSNVIKNDEEPQVDNKLNKIKSAKVHVVKVMVNETLEKVFFYLDSKLEKDQEYYLRV